MTIADLEKFCGEDGNIDIYKLMEVSKPEITIEEGTEPESANVRYRFNFDENEE